MRIVSSYVPVNFYSRENALEQVGRAEHEVCARVVCVRARAHVCAMCVFVRCFFFLCADEFLLAGKCARTSWPRRAQVYKCIYVCVCSVCVLRAIDEHIRLYMRACICVQGT